MAVRPIKHRKYETISLFIAAMAGACIRQYALAHETTHEDGACGAPGPLSQDNAPHGGRLLRLYHLTYNDSSLQLLPLLASQTHMMRM